MASGWDQLHDIEALERDISAQRTVSPASTYPRRRHAIHRGYWFTLGLTIGGVLAVLT